MTANAAKDTIAQVLAMPPEWALHERTLIAWPTRADLWGSLLDAAKDEYAATANAIAEFEPVTMVASDDDVDDARRRCASGVTVIALPLDDSWLRDSGPIVVRNGVERVAVDFVFNSWGQKFHPFDRDAKLAARLADQLGMRVRPSKMVLEGGSISIDDQGTLITTEQCLLNPNRNPRMDRHEIEVELMGQLGANRVVWLGQGLLEDRDTDGHVDLVASFLPSGEVLLLDVDAINPNFEHCQENRARLTAEGLTVRSMPFLAYAEAADEEVAVSYMNYYVCNGAVIMPLAGTETDEAARLRLAELHPDHEVVGVPAVTLAYGGGGPHCITQQVPAL
jgi:agmatine deiminase